MNTILREKIITRSSGIVTYGFTPPKQQNSPEKIAEIAARQIARINSLPIDGLAVYDIQDEAERTSEDRPFPFLATIDPYVYSSEHLAAVSTPKIIYRVAGKYKREDMAAWMDKTKISDSFSVFVGVSADNQKVNMTLADCYSMAREINPDMLIGGVIIPERHMLLADEHLRVASKIESGCSFFISQIVYNTEASKSFLSSYSSHFAEKGQDLVPVIFTIAPCGSLKTLGFMKWLGVSVPEWLENDLTNSVDILDKSVEACLGIFEELLNFCLERNIPVGCNIESLAIRKEEIEASVYLTNEIKKMMLAKGLA